MGHSFRLFYVFVFLMSQAYKNLGIFIAQNAWKGPTIH